MKASEVLQNYAAGERNFRGLNLSGQSFHSEDLSEADFSEADIRGANFSEANLRGAKFYKTRAGVTTSWIAASLIISLILALIPIALPTLVIWWLFSIGVESLVRIYYSITAVIVLLPLFSLSAFGRFQWRWLYRAVAFLFICVPSYIVVIQALIENNFTNIAWLGLLAIFWQYVYFTHNIRIAVFAVKGTNFRDANLIDADFAEAMLKNADFTKAILTRTNWYQAKKLDKAIVDSTILTNPKIRDLVVTRQGAGQNYFWSNLRGVNLAHANLENANFTGTDLSEANLEKACLENSNLTRARVLGTNFQGAILTGATLEDWQVNKDTKIEDVTCDYVYLRQNQDNQLERFPKDPHKNFAPGEFTKLSQKTLETIDLIFREPIDWQAFSNSWEKLQIESGENKLAIQSIEEKNDDSLVIQVKIPSDLDKGRITEFFQREYSNILNNYQQAIVATEEKYKIELQAKEEQIEIYRQEISHLRKVVEKLSKSPIVINSNNDIDEAV